MLASRQMETSRTLPALASPKSSRMSLNLGSTRSSSSSYAGDITSGTSSLPASKQYSDHLAKMYKRGSSPDDLFGRRETDKTDRETPKVSNVSTGPKSPFVLEGGQDVEIFAAPEPSNPLQRLDARLTPFVQRLASYSFSTTYSDVTLCADNVDFPCHRFVLACSSAYFAKMFESGFIESSQQRVELPGKTSDGVRSVLRVLYFDATPREILAEDVHRAVEVLDIAREWLLPDVMEQVVEYVEREVTSMDELEWLCQHLGFAHEQLQMRQICETRLVKMHEDKRFVEDERIKRDMLDKDERNQMPRTAGGRWPAGQQRRAEHWTAPVKCPKGLGW